LGIIPPTKGFQGFSNSVTYPVESAWNIKVPNLWEKLSNIVGQLECHGQPDPFRNANCLSFEWYPTPELTQAGNNGINRRA